MDTDNPKFRFYAERVITNLVTHYKDNPAVIGWQIDNERPALTALPMKMSSTASSTI